MRLLASGHTISTTESGTAGLIGSSIASLLGSKSSPYKGTIVANTIELKKKLLDVQDIVLKNGEVSAQVAQQMALVGLYKLDSTVCIGITADVNGYGYDKSIPTEAWICVAYMVDNKVNFEYKKLVLNGKRGDNVQNCIMTSLKMTFEALKN